MVIIASSTFDQSTNEVIDWLRYLNIDYIRINQETEIEINKIELSNNSFFYSFNIDKKTVNSNLINGYWYRRGGLGYIKQPNLKLKESSIKREIQDHLEGELFELKNFFIKALEKNSNKIGSFYLKSLNKLEILLIAKELGFRIPETFVINCRTDLNQIKGNLITKAIQETKSYNLNLESIKGVYALYTTEITDRTKIPQKIFPTKVQTNIKKKFEIRSFYLNGKIFSMAIFSQTDSQTKTDFRKYNILKPNRNVPYQLPIEIEEKIILLMNRLQLNNGSLDIIKDVNNEFYFLEVNPIGQFGMVSHPCNYFLEKLIAKNFN